jgi:hypothetical protein
MVNTKHLTRGNYIFLSNSKIRHRDVQNTYITTLRENMLTTKKSYYWKDEQGEIIDFFLS